MTEPAPSPTRTVWNYLPVVFLLAILPWLLWLPGSQFTSDDFWFVGEGRLPTDKRAACTVLQSFSGDWLTGASGRGGWFRPLARLHFWVDDVLWGVDRPWGYHLTNNLIHGLSVVLVALLFQILTTGGETLGSVLRRGSPSAIVAALFFAFTPAAGGAVGWVSARTDVLSTFFLLLMAVGCVLPIGRRWRLVLSTGAVILACLAKESGYVGPGLAGIVLAAHWLHHRRWQDVIGLFLSITAAAGLLFIYRGWILGGMGGYGGTFSASSAVRWWLEFAHSLTWLPGTMVPLLFLPVGLFLLSIKENFPSLPSLAPLLAGIGWMVVAGIVVFGLELLPVENGRYLYLAGVGFAFVLGSLARSLERHLTLSACAQFLLLSLLLLWFVWSLAQTALAWKEASRVTRQITSTLINQFQSSPPDRTNIIVFREMDFATFTALPLQTWRGGKVLPWDQAAWATYRLSKGAVMARWGFAPDLIDIVSPRLAIIGLGTDDYTPHAFDTLPPVVREVIEGPPQHWRLPLRELAEAHAHPGPFYAVVAVTLTAGVSWHPHVRSPSRRIHAPGYLHAGQQGTFVMNIGSYPDWAGEGWYFHPPGLNEGTEVHKVTVYLHPMLDAID